MGQECIMISIFVLCALPIGGGRYHDLHAIACQGCQHSDGARALSFGRIPINMFGLVTPSLLEKGVSESPSLLPCLTYRTGGIIVSIIIVWLVVASLSGKHIS